MTKEQETIERLNRIITTKFNNDYSIDSSDKEAIETVLNILKEKDNIINEQLKENVELRKELNEENKRCMILANNDKFKEQVIDLMAEQIKIPEPTMKIESFDIKSKTKFGMRYLNKEEVKQYFERKIRE